MLVPARVFVVARFLVFAYFEHAEHSAHLDTAKRAFAGHHLGGVVRQRHVHLRHVSHAALAHHHVIGDDVGDFFHDVAVVYAYQGRHIVAHGVHGVVALVAMKCPVAFFVG